MDEFDTDDSANIRGNRAIVVEMVFARMNRRWIEATVPMFDFLCSTYCLSGCETPE
jgi:hypothetical protein